MILQLINTLKLFTFVSSYVANKWKFNWKKLNKIEQAREFQKNIYFCYIVFAKAFAQITINWGKSFKRWEYQTTFPVSWKTCMQVKKQQLELDMEQWTGSKLEKQ